MALRHTFDTFGPIMKTFETPSFLMKIHDNCLIEFKIKKDISFTAADVWHSRDLSVEYLPGKKFFVLTEAEDVFSPKQDARKAGASKEYSEHVQALAFFSKNLTLKIIGNLYIKVSRPITPTRFFDEREKALEWLDKQRNLK
jgi:hypothetical protein